MNTITPTATHVLPVTGNPGTVRTPLVLGPTLGANVSREV